MLEHDTARAARRRKRVWRAMRDRQRGFAVNGKFLGLAIFIEAAIISSSLYAGYLFAEKYASGPGGSVLPTEVAALSWLPLSMVSGHSLDWWMAIVGAAMLAACELARIPLAMAFRSHRHFNTRLVALIGVAAMVLVTTKTVGTVLGQAYHVRRLAVIEATDTLKLAEADLATVTATKGSANQALAPLQIRVDEANKRLAELNDLIAQQGKAPATVCTKIPHRDKKTGRRWTEMKCSTPKWAGQQFADQLVTALSERDAAVTARDAAAQAVGGEVERVASQEKLVAEARAQQRDAVMNSQLHDFAGIVLGKDAVDISEQELNWFLRLFVLVPALLIAAASTLLAMVAFTRIPRRREPQPIIVQLPGALRGEVGNDNAEPRAA